MAKTLNYVLNKILGVANRYRDILVTHPSTKFLPNFNIQVNKQSGKQDHKVTIGENCLLGVAVILEANTAEVIIGDRVYMGNSSIISKTSVIFGNDILVATGVIFYDHDSHSLDHNKRDKDIKQSYSDYVNENGNYVKNKSWDGVNSAPIKIGDHAWIGTEALILKGVTIGEGAIVGARSVVTKDVPPFTIVAGNPAKVVKHLTH